MLRYILRCINHLSSVPSVAQEEEEAAGKRGITSAPSSGLVMEILHKFVPNLFRMET